MPCRPASWASRGYTGSTLRRTRGGDAPPGGAGAETAAEVSAPAGGIGQDGSLATTPKRAIAPLDGAVRKVVAGVDERCTPNCSDRAINRSLNSTIGACALPWSP